MAGVKGIDILVLIQNAVTPTTYDEVGGQRGATLSESADTIEMTHKASNGYKEYEYAFNDWTVDCDGLYITGDVGYDALVDALRTKKKVVLRWTEGGTQKYEGTALVVSRDLDGPYDGEATFKVSFQGSGAPTLV